MLIVSMWTLGGSQLWSQWLLAAISGSCLVGLFLPLRLLGQQWESETRAVEQWYRLRRFPLFWLGLLFLSYITVQGLNPAWQWTENADYHWLEPIPHIEWLPSGTATPFEQMNPFRMLLIMGTIWMAVCALWAGVRHRRSLLFLFWVVSLNGTLGALSGILFKIKGVEKVLGVWTYGYPFLGPFLYENHAAAFWNLCLAVTLGLFLYYQRRTQLTLAGSGPHIVFLLAGLILLAGVLFSLSRGGILFAFLTVGAALLPGLIGSAKGLRRGSVFISFIGLGIFGGLGWGLYQMVDVEAVQREYERLWDGFEELNEGSRSLMNEATYRMFRDQKWYGWGAGSFRFYFPTYQQDYPTLWKNGKRQLFWRYAHNDWLQYLAEYGIVGCTLIGLMLLYVFSSLIFFYNRLILFNLIICLGGCLLLVHALFDFVFQNISILLTFIMVATANYQLQRWEAKRNKLNFG